MALGGSVAGFARNAEFADVRFDGATGGIEMRLHPGGVTTAANNIPGLRPLRHVRRTNEGGAARNPALLGNQPGEWETDLQVSVSFSHPKNLHVMGTRHEANPRVGRF